MAAPCGSYFFLRATRSGVKCIARPRYALGNLCCLAMRRHFVRRGSVWGREKRKSSRWAATGASRKLGIFNLAFFRFFSVFLVFRRDHDSPQPHFASALRPQLNAVVEFSEPSRRQASTGISQSCSSEFAYSHLGEFSAEKIVHRPNHADPFSQHLNLISSERPRSKVYLSRRGKGALTKERGHFIESVPCLSCS